MRIAPFFFAMLVGINAFGVIRYVDVNSAAPAPPYTNWASAAVTIQDAVDAAGPGDEIFVASGVYRNGGKLISTPFDKTTNRVALCKPIAVRSVNGPAVTLIEGFQVTGTTNGSAAIRGVYMTNGTFLTGFTITNGATANATSNIMDSGGGIYGESYPTNTSGIASNCIIVGNASADYGGGAFGVTLFKCALIGNVSNGGGGAANSSLRNCVLTDNVAAQRSGPGVQYPYGGGAASSSMENCLIIRNSANLGGGAYDSDLMCCTVVSNKATSGSGGIAPSITHSGTGLRGATNSIVIFNTAPIGPNGSGGGLAMRNCCIYPSPGGIENMESDPLFVDPANGDYRLQSTSPCINAGWNVFATDAVDLSGDTRNQGGTIDVGAYEFQSPASIISYAWLLQYGLAIDGSDDFTDPDGDGHNNWQEWRSGTGPTNAFSALRLQAPTNSVSGSVVVRWSSVAFRMYWIERATNPISPASFVTIATNRPGITGFTSFTDTTATNADAYFYRVGVQ